LRSFKVASFGVVRRRVQISHGKLVQGLFPDR
jgi:hypothetical protein